MELNVLSADNKKSTLEVSDIVFGSEFKEALIHQVVVAHQAKARSGSSKQKTRSEVRGGGAKPWNQKGTGRARAGTIRSPLWRSGGVTFAARPRNYEQKVNRKMYRAAVRSILSELYRQERLIVVDDFAVEGPKTKLLAAKLAEMNLTNALIVKEAVEDNLYLAARNLVHINVVDTSATDPVSLVAFDKVVMTVPAVKQFEELLG